MALEATHRAKHLAALNTLKGRRAGRRRHGSNGLIRQCSRIVPARTDQRICSTIGRRHVRMRTICYRTRPQGTCIKALTV